jgi:colanic acid/amylovoran biosynthesis glycosyltransferase
LRLAIVVNSFPTLSETFIFNKVMGLLHSGVDVTVFVSSRKNDRALFPEIIPGKRLPRIHHLISSYRDSVKYLYAIWIILTHLRLSVRLLHNSSKLYPGSRRAIKAFLLALPFVMGRYDIIHFEFSGIAVAFLDALPLLKPIKLVTSCRGAAEQITPLMDNSRAGQLGQVLKSMDSVHCVSQDMLRTVEKYGLDPGKAFINRPAIDLEQFHRNTPYPNCTTGPYHLVSVSRLHWKKGLEFGILAVKLLLDKGYEIQYDIIGTGPEEERLRFMIHDLGLAGHVNLLGRLSSAQVQEALEKADIFLLPSLSEGISNSILEAMAMELPVISTKAGGMDEAIFDGQEGFLIPTYNVKLLGEKILSCIKNYDLRQKMGMLGRIRVEQEFNITNQVRKFEEQYIALTKTSPKIR